MTDHASFEDLYMHYDIDSGSIVSNGHDIHRSDGKMMQYAYQGAQAYPAGYSYRPSTMHAPPFAPPQQTVQELDDETLADGFDFQRAEATGLVASSPKATMSQALSDYSFSEPTEIRDLTSRQESRTFGGQRAYNNNAFRPPQQQKEIVVEPEPGRQVRLVPVAALRK